MFRLKISFMFDDSTLAQVTKFYSFVFSDKNIKRFDIPMYDVVRMTMQKSDTQLPSNLPNFSLREVLTLTLLIINELIHIALFCIFNRNVK